MLVRIRLPKGAAMRRNKRRIAPFTFIVAGLLRMAAVSCLMLALWRLTNDLGWTGEFVVADGFFSHWQVWLALTFALSMLSFRLSRYARPAEVVVGTFTTVGPVAPRVGPSVAPPADDEPEKPELARRIVTR